MSDIKTSEALDILDKIQFFGGQMAGRELWFDKKEEIQEKDLANFNRDVEIIRKYVKSTQNVLERIVERLGKYRNFEDNDSLDRQCIDRAIEIVKEEGGIE